jgi:hypothetical protein
MKLFTTSILFFFGIFGVSNSNDVPQILDEYIKWTKTGETYLSNIIFDIKVDLTYQVSEGEFESTPFYEYLGKVEIGATSVPRSMAVTHFNLAGNHAIAYLTDISIDGDFSLVHILSLRKKKNEWRINAIKIVDGY